MCAGDAPEYVGQTSVGLGIDTFTFSVCLCVCVCLLVLNDPTSGDNGCIDGQSNKPEIVCSLVASH